MSKYKLSSTIDVDIEVAEQIIDSFFKLVPKVKQFLDSIGELGKKRGYIRTADPYRRTRYFQQWNGKSTDFKTLGEIERQSKNTPIQGGNANLTKLSLCNIYSYIQSNKLPVKIVNIIHDEILTECLTEYAPIWKDQMSKIMSETGSLFVKSIPMPVDCKIMDCWQK